MGFFILNVKFFFFEINFYLFILFQKLEDGKYAKTDTYVAHITCSESPSSWLLATSK
jgi:hypothetical protein